MARTTQKRKASSRNTVHEFTLEIEQENDSDDRSSPEAPSPKRGKKNVRAARGKAQAKIAHKDSDDDIDSDDLPEEDDEDFMAEKPKKPRQSQGRKGNSNTQESVANGTTSNTKKARKANGAGGGRGRGKKGGHPSAVTKGRGNAASKEDLPVKDDNTLFNSIKDPETALQTTAEDWIVKYHAEAGPALAEMVNFVIRTCGCNGTVDQDVAQDLDAIVDSLDDLQEEFKKEAIPSYPIVSRAKPYSKFRRSLAEFLDRLVSSAADAEVLYDDAMMDTFKAWVSAMSSSSIRSFRHTATVMALWTVTSISTVNEQAKKDLSSLIKQRDVEKKKPRHDKARLRELESKVSEARGNKNKLDGYLKDLIDSVFVHRYRDADAGIRSECVSELGIWMKRFPTAFLQGSYFRYLGWVLSDTDAGVRIAAIEAMAALYSGESFAGQIKHFTDMFKGRLVEMANGDVDLRVRIATIGVLVSIDRHDLLDEEQRDSLAAHMFDVEPKVRKAVAAFVAGLLDELVEEQKEELTGAGSTQKKKRGTFTSDNIDENETSKLRLKCLASLLVKFEQRVDKAEAEAKSAAAASAEDGSGSEEGFQSNSNSHQRKLDDLSSVVDHDREGRIGMAVEALWNSVEHLQEWQPCIELLLYDHSENGGSPQNSKRKSQKSSEAIGEQPPEEAYRLEPAEEAVLIEALVAILRTVRQNAENPKDKEEEDTSRADLTRALMPALPKLFAKYRTDAPRISEILLIPQIMDLGMYLEMSDISGYEVLWDDITAQFTRHVEPVLLRHAVAAMRCLNSFSALSNTNIAKLSSLEETLINSLRDITQGRDVDTTAFSEDEIHDLGACILRLNYLFQVTDLSASLEDDDNKKLSSAWDIIIGLASRGRLGYREERKMIEDALKVLTLHLTWQTKTLVTTNDPSSATVEKLLEKRTALLDLMFEFVGGGVSNACTGVQRVAFDKLLHIHLMYNSISVATESTQPEGEVGETPVVKLPRELRLTCEEETQFRCAGFVQAEMERYLEQITAEKSSSSPEEKNGKDGDSDSDMDSDKDSDATPELTKKTPKTKKSKVAANAKSKDEIEARPSQAFLEREVIFCSTISQFITAIRVGVVDIQHGTGLLAQFGKLSSVFDACLKILVETLREQGVLNGRGDEVCKVILDCIEESFDAYLDDGLAASESSFVSLCRHISSALVIRGAHLSILRTIPTARVTVMHTQAIDYVVTKYNQAEQANDKSKKSKVPAFFKGLAQLLWATSPKESLKIKGVMEKALADADFEVPATAKAWEPQRSYEKRLLTIASKDKRLATGDPKAAAATPQQKKSSAPVGAQNDENDEAEADALLGEASAPASRPKPKPRATAAAREVAATSTSPAKTAPTRKRPRDTFLDDEPEDQGQDQEREQEQEEADDDLDIQSGAGDQDDRTDADLMDLDPSNPLGDDEEVDIFANLGAADDDDDDDDEEEEPEPSPEVGRKKRRKN